LDSAIALLPDAPRNGQTGRVTKWAAMAFKGRLQMYTRDYTGALTTLRAVVASGKYKLETSFDHVWTGFKQYANGPETILAFQASVNDGQPDGNNGNYGERLNFPYVAPFCCGFHQPSQNLVNFFAVNDSGLPLALSSPTTWNTRDTSFTATTTVKVDPRLDWTVGRDNVPYKDWGLHRPSFVRDRSYSGPYSPKKNVHEKASGAQSKVGWNPAQLNSVHLHIFRYADVLLLLAEAEVEAGTVDAARLLVNQIRTRAGQTAEGCGSGSTDTTLSRVYPTCVGDDRIAVPLVGAATLGVTTNSDSLLAPWATYKIGLYTAPWADPNLARTYVHWERRLELAMEGKRFFDLRRWGTATDSLNAYIAVEKRRRAWMVNAVPFSTKHSLYPIPQVQIDLSTVGTQSTLKQNTGW
jgi:hypothetical protein